MEGKDKENTYFWGVMTESTSTIREERILFQPAEDGTPRTNGPSSPPSPSGPDRPQDDRR